MTKIFCGETEMLLLDMQSLIDVDQLSVEMQKILTEKDSKEIGTPGKLNRNLQPLEVSAILLLGDHFSKNICSENRSQILKLDIIKPNS